MQVRHIVILVETDVELSAALLNPGVEIHHVATEDGIDMALLNDPHSPCILVFLGGERAKTFSERYGGLWIADGPNR